MKQPGEAFKVSSKPKRQRGFSEPIPIAPNGHVPNGVNKSAPPSPPITPSLPVVPPSHRRRTTSVLTPSVPVNTLGSRLLRLKLGLL